MFAIINKNRYMLFITNINIGGTQWRTQEFGPARVSQPNHNLSSVQPWLHSGFPFS